MVLDEFGRVTSDNPEVAARLEQLTAAKAIPKFMDNNASQCNCTNNFR